MSQITLNISAKQLDKEINYINPIQKTILNKSTDHTTLSQMNFLVINTREGVSPKKKEVKEFIKIAVKTLAISISILTLVDPTFTFAATVATGTEVSQNAITPPDIIKLCKYLLGICVTIGFSLAILTSVIASSWGYFRKTNEAFKWVTEIIKSFVMMMLAPTIIVTIAFLAYLLFGSSDWFIKPF